MQQSNTQTYSVESLFNSKFTLNNHVVQPSDYCIEVNGELKKIPPKVMQVLIHIAAAGDFAISREELIERIWLNSLDIGRNSLKTAVYQLRKLLDEPSTTQSVIQTVARSGYKLAAQIKIIDEKKIDSPSVPLLKTATPIIRPTNGLSLTNKVARLLVSTTFIALSVLVYFYKDSVFPAPAPEQVYAELLFSRTGIERYPQASPDNTKLVFVGQDSNGFDNIFIRELSEVDIALLQVTSSQNIEHSPVWGPEGKRLAFVRHTEDGLCSVHTIDISTKIENKLVECFGELSLNRFISWSPDGEWLAFSSSKANEAESGIFRISLLTGIKEQLTWPESDIIDYKPTWSPDNQSLAFVRKFGSHQHDILTLKLDKQALPVRVTHDAKYSFGMSWLPDGDKIIFSSNRNERVQLWLLDLNTKNLSLFSHDEDLFYPSLSRDGTTLYAVQYQRQSHIYSLSLDNANVVKPVLRHLGLNTSPDFSSAHDKLIFQSNRTGFMEVWSSKIDGSNLTQMTNFQNRWFILSRPKWAPVGDKYAFVAASDDIDQIFIGAQGQTDNQQLTSSPTNKESFSWSLDGNFVYASVKNKGLWAIWKFAVDGTYSALVTDKNGCYAQEGVKGGVSTLYITKCNKQGIFEIDAQTGSETLIIPNIPFVDKENWVVVESGIYFVTRSFENDVIKFYNFTSQMTSVISVLAPNTVMPLERLSYTKEKNQLYFSHPINLQSEVYKLNASHFKL